MYTSYLSLVKEVLAEDLGQPFPPSIKEKELQVRLQLLTQIAVSSIPSSLTDSPNLSKKVSERESESLDETKMKIKEFVKEHAYGFWQACESGITFSKLDQATCERALGKTFKGDDSIIVHLLNQDRSAWFTEDELEEKFEKAFKHLNTEEILNACYHLKRAYKRQSDHKAGYYMLWLIRRTSGGYFKIPSKETFNKSTVKTVLSHFFSSDDSTLKYTTKFIELLFSVCDWHWYDTPIYAHFLKPDCHSKFFNFTFNQFQSIPMTAWPQKTSLIHGFLKALDVNSKTVLAQVLESSPDPETAKIGHHILHALKSETLKAALPHFYALIELFPSLNHKDIETIFDRPFEPLRHNSKKDPDFTRRVKFTHENDVVVCGDLMIGVRERNGMPPFLLAYNMQTEKMQWGLTVAPRPSEDLRFDSTSSDIPQMRRTDYRLYRVGDNIVLQFKGDQNAPIIDSGSGEVKDTIALPYEIQNEQDRLHFTPSGFGYQFLRTPGKFKLIGGKISESSLNPVFEIHAPNGFFTPLSTHVGFLNYVRERKLYLFSPTGQSVTFVCAYAYASGEKLYCIEPNPSDKSTCLLTVRTMTVDDHVVSAPEKSLLIKGRRTAFIEGLCDNGQLILNTSEPIFVDIDRETVVYTKRRHPFSISMEVINTVTGEVWSCEHTSRKVWKISSEKTELMEFSMGGSLLHVDREDHLYFIS